jgi:hypothetical protein
VRWLAQTLARDAVAVAVKPVRIFVGIVGFVKRLHRIVRSEVSAGRNTGFQRTPPSLDFTR